MIDIFVRIVGINSGLIICDGKGVVYKKTKTNQKTKKPKNQQKPKTNKQIFVCWI